MARLTTPRALILLLLLMWVPLTLHVMFGHALGAAGALEGVATVLALHHRCLPPTANFTEPDPQCDLDVIPNRARAAEAEAKRAGEDLERLLAQERERVRELEEQTRGAQIVPSVKKREVGELK